LLLIVRVNFFHKSLASNVAPHAHLTEPLFLCSK